MEMTSNSSAPVIVQGQPTTLTTLATPTLPIAAAPPSSNGAQPMQQYYTPPPPPPDEWALPLGWKMGHRDTDGRVYYYHSESGKSSWEHPNASTTTSTKQQQQSSSAKTMLSTFGIDKHLSNYGLDKHVDGMLQMEMDPPPPPPIELTPGWKQAKRESDGRVYYYHEETGQTTWENPAKAAAAATTAQHRSDGLLSNVGAAASNTLLGDLQKQPKNHRCLAWTALFCCLPLGLCALWNSMKVNRSWNNGHYGSAENSSRRTSQLSSWAVVCGGAILVWLLYRNDWQLPDSFNDFNFGDWHWD